MMQLGDLKCKEMAAKMDIVRKQRIYIRRKQQVKLLEAKVLK